MVKDSITRLLSNFEEILEELYVADSIVNMIKSACLNSEFNGQYYGISNECSAKLSAERNNYINMLTILSEKISNIMSLNISSENEVLLQKNSYNSSRKITTQCSAD